jgi:hypothetical protein
VDVTRQGRDPDATNDRKNRRKPKCPYDNDSSSHQSPFYRTDQSHPGRISIGRKWRAFLMVILGNVSLLLRDIDNQDKALTKKLKSIEKAAKRIQYVTARLLRVTKPISVEYIDGIQMLDITDVTRRED